MAELKLSEVKILKVKRESPNSVFYKSSYSEQQFKEVTVIKKKKPPIAITLSKAFDTKPGLPKNKRDDINDLIKKNLIPRFYKQFYENL